MMENFINNRSITTIPNQMIFACKSTSVRFFEQWCPRRAFTMNKFGTLVYEKIEHDF